MKKRCKSCSKFKEVREIEIEGFKGAYYCLKCYPKAIKVIEFIQEQEGCDFESAKKLFGRLQVKIKNDRHWARQMIRLAKKRRNER